MDDYTRGLLSGMAAAFEVAAEHARRGVTLTAEQFDEMAARQRSKAWDESPNSSRS